MRCTPPQKVKYTGIVGLLEGQRLQVFQGGSLKPLLRPHGNGLGNRILEGLARSLERQHPREKSASAIDPTLDRAYRAIAQRSRFTIGKSICRDEQKRLPHFVGQAAERLA